MDKAGYLTQIGLKYFVAFKLGKLKEGIAQKGRISLNRIPLSGILKNVMYIHI
jgi:hypothetical protein